MGRPQRNGVAADVTDIRLPPLKPGELERLRRDVAAATLAGIGKTLAGLDDSPTLRQASLTELLLEVARRIEGKH